jgi:hypothetical protein
MKEDGMDRERSTHGTDEKYIHAENPEGKRPVARPRHRCECSVKMDLKIMEVEGCGLDWLSIRARGRLL